MTPHQLAVAECCNLIASSCLGCSFRIEDDGQVKHYQFRERGPCTIGTDARCEHFERCVLPLADRLPTGPAIRDAYNQRFVDKPGEKPTTSTTRTRLGKCGHPVAKGKRLCPDCAVKRNRESWRKSKRSSRCPKKSIITLDGAISENGENEVSDGIRPQTALSTNGRPLGGPVVAQDRGEKEDGNGKEAYRVCGLRVEWEPRVGCRDNLKRPE